ncbi:hypothetical protein BK816_06130 [Boudabousia tangfeifanii]|uniref:NAD(P)-binding domain-containing protein n=1 Tax=Boudabousia tangfeifanii TaxID=1912795 RepID=A0A1D9MKV8_9ACTO|nr:NAD(P)H-binding protein [Boudabousia tangfeifanii]AOZ72922.1 hypothetical protein BK816_06130 [Boudabousia tangfeifanii]
MRIAISGVTGTVGKRVSAGIRVMTGDDPALDRQHRTYVRLLSRTPEKIVAGPSSERAFADYADAEAMRKALNGCDVFLMFPAVEADNMAAMHELTIGAAKAVGVHHVVYLSFQGAQESSSFPFAREHAQTEKLLAESGMDYTIVRTTFTTDKLPGLADENKVISGPAGNGACAFVAEVDLADCLIGILADIAAGGGGGHSRRTYTITGPIAMTLADAVGALNHGSRHEAGFSYRAETLEQAKERLLAAHPEVNSAMLSQWASTYEGMANGELSEISRDMRKLIGTDGLSVESWAQQNL